jgi:hypothetical protein
LAQTLVLDTFNQGATTGSVIAGTSWVGNVTQNTGSITVGGTATDVNGWAATGRTIDATGLNFVTLTAQRDSGHAAPSVVVQFEDRNLNTQVFSVAASSFTAGSLTTINIPITGWSAGFDPKSITSWSIGGGGIGATAFRMTFDQLALSATAGTGASVPVVAGSFGAVTRNIGQILTLTVSATGTAPLAYQWSKNGTAVSGATAATLTVASVTALDAGNYSCAVTNSAGTTISGVFAVTINATAATVTLAGLTATYSGAPRTVTATTSPFGLAVTITYNGSANAPTAAGSYAVVATISDASYTGRAEGTLVIARAPQSIALAPLPATLTAGTAFALSGTATSGGPVTFTVLAGSATFTGTSLTINSTAAATLRATQAGDTNYLPATYDFTLTTTKRNQSIDFPALSTPPVGATSLLLAASASSGLPVGFAVVSGPAAVSGNTLLISGTGTVIVRATQGGNDAFNAAPQVDRPVEVSGPSTPPPPPPPPDTPLATGGRIVNLSILTELTAAGEDFTLGTAIGGSGTSGGKPLVVRAVGPALSSFGVANPLADPAVEFFAGTTKIGENDNWGGSPALGASFAAVGAFPFPTAASRDAAIATTVTATGAHSIRVRGIGPATGTVLAELYDATASSEFTAATPRLVNVSILKQIGEGFTLGFVIGGTTARTVLVRAVGPGLAGVGVTSGFVADPQLKLFAGTVQRDANDNWGGSALLAAVMTRVGAFALPPASRDAALLAKLEPGSYSVQVSGVGAGRGLVIFEIYEAEDPRF